MKVVQGPDNNREEQLNRMVMQYEQDLLRMCVVYLRDTPLAQDAVQETFLQAYKSLSAFRGDCGEKTWLITIALNVCRNFRKSAWHRFVERRVPLDDMKMSYPQPSLERIELTTEIMRLPRKHMEVVLLYYYQDMSTKEIAQALGISIPAVSQRLSKAISRLHFSLGGGVESGS
jgi:RNA polymerase sigma-70 factor (ECF subfamily)